MYSVYLLTISRYIETIFLGFILSNNCVSSTSDHMELKTLTYITSNSKGLDELIRILGPHIPYQVVHRPVILPEVQGSIAEICRKKCVTARRRIQNSVIVEDTSLGFRALDGLPGPYINWFARKLGATGLYKMLSGFQDKSAKAVCTFAFADMYGPVRLFQGETYGHIVEPRDVESRRWDACFQPEGHNRTYSEMFKIEKKFISHRFKALLKLRAFLESYKPYDQWQPTNHQVKPENEEHMEKIKEGEHEELSNSQSS